MVDGLTLVRADPDHLDRLVEAVNVSLASLRPWMPWAQQPATNASIGSFLEEAVASWEDGRDFHFAMAIAGPVRTAPEIAGYCGLHDRVGPGALEIGYWVRSDRSGRGLATAAAGALARAALALTGIDRVEIRCDPTNLASAAIPPKVGFRLDRLESRVPETPGDSGQLMVWNRRCGDLAPSADLAP